MLDVLVIAPHPDDAEIGVGGTIALLLSQGHRVGILDLTDGEPTPAGSPDLRQRESEAASLVLGITWRRCLGLPNRNLRHTLDNRWELASVIREVRPKVLIAPYWEDAHPDHIAASELVDAARFWAKLSKSDLRNTPHLPAQVYYYFSLHLRSHERPSLVVDISDTIELKVKCVACYESQLQSLSRGSASSGGILEELRARARYWGIMTGTDYGEPLVCRETVGMKGLPELP